MGNIFPHVSYRKEKKMYMKTTFDIIFMVIQTKNCDTVQNTAKNKNYY